MDLQKIRVRQDLERMIINYYLLNEISKEQSNKICDYIDITIGGGEFPKSAHEGYHSVIQFPTSYEGNNAPTVNKDEAGINDHEVQQGYEKVEVINAPYGTALPDNVPDFRETLQRDGLILIKWEKRISDEGTFYNVLWVQSGTGRRNTEWSGELREEYIPYALPLDDNRYSNYFHKKTNLIYAVNVAPENVLHGPFSEFTEYVRNIKATGMKDAFGKKIDFEYVYNFAAEKRGRWLFKNHELLELKIPARVINILNGHQIFTVNQLKKLSIKKLQEARNIGNQTFIDTLALLEEAEITLQSIAEA